MLLRPHLRMFCNNLPILFSKYGLQNHFPRVNKKGQQSRKTFWPRNEFFQSDSDVFDRTLVIGHRFKSTLGIDTIGKNPMQSYLVFHILRSSTVIHLISNSWSTR